MNERYVEFFVESAKLAGIITPADGTTGLLIIVGGPQYRVGSHRQFVKLCRAAAACGIPAFRFDVRGMGDSEGAALPFYQQSTDIRAAIGQFFSEQPQLQKVVLWGLCDGASSILITLREQQDPRIAAVVLVNPWVRQAHSYAQTMVKHYYAKRLLEKEFWQKILSGKFPVIASLRGFWHTLRQSKTQGSATSKPHLSAKLTTTTAENYVGHMYEGLADFAGSLCIITSGNDLTAQEFLDYCKQDHGWQHQLSRAQHHHLDEANHTFSTQAWRQQVEAITTDFINRIK